MISKLRASADEALSSVSDGATVMISGFGSAGIPETLISALLRREARDLVLICNNAGTGETGVAALLKAGLVRKIVCSFPRQNGPDGDSHVFDSLYRAGAVELDLVPQGSLAERIRAGGAGIPAFYTPTAVGTELAHAKEIREFGGRHYVLEEALSADLAMIKVDVCDHWGNAVYRKAARNFGPIMAMAATYTAIEASQVVEVGALDPEHIVTPGVFIDAVVVTSH